MTFEEECMEIEKLNMLHNDQKSIDRAKKYREHLSLIEQIENLINCFPKQHHYEYRSTHPDYYYVMFSKFRHKKRDRYGLYLDQAKNDLEELILLLKFELNEIANDI